MSRRGPECVDPPGKKHPTWFADWELHENGLSVSFRMWEVQAYEDDGRNIFVKKDTGDSRDLMHRSYDPLECEPRITGFRKWDGCTQWFAPTEDDVDRLLFHVDDMEDFEASHAAMRNVFRVCAEMIGDKWDGGEQ